MSGMMGQRVLRREDARFLVGDGLYVENLELPGALHAVFVRSPYAHARILGVDVSAARERPGHRCSPPPTSRSARSSHHPFPAWSRRWGGPFLAHDVVRFVGDIVAVVVAESRADAVDAAELVVVDYEPLPVVVDPSRRWRARCCSSPRPGRTSA